MSASEFKASFFRQGGWMMIATFVGGVFMFAVHVFSVFMPQSEYGLFNALLQILNLMMIPALGLQSTFAQQAAAALDPDAESRLRATTRAVLVSTFGLWSALCCLALLFSPSIIATLRITNPAALWVTAGLGLPMLWTPVFLGVLQGRQNFLWLGWALLLTGVLRFIAVGVLVAILGGYATGAITGAFIGMLAGLLIGAWHTHDVWGQRGDGFQLPDWFRRILPLTLGLGAGQFMLAFDMIVVQSSFTDQTGIYGAAGMIGRGLVVFTAPIALVIFPKIVRSVASSTTTDVLARALIGTALLGAFAATACSIVAWNLPWLGEQLLQTTAPSLDTLRTRIAAHRDTLRLLRLLIPWFVWCMLPFALANILIYNLLARERYRTVPWLVGIALAYAATLALYHPSFLAVIRTIGVFSLALFVAALYFSRDGLRSAPTSTSP